MTAIPFLFHLILSSQKIGFNSLIRNENVKHETSLDEFLSIPDLPDGDLFIDGISANEMLSIFYIKSTLRNSMPAMLRLLCGVDSVDFVSYPWAGHMFGKTIVTVLRLFQPSYAGSLKYLALNKNLSRCVPDLGLFPGQYFLNSVYSSVSSRWNGVGDIRDPFAVRLIFIYKLLYHWGL